MTDQTPQLAPEIETYMQWGAQLRAELAQTLAGVWLRGARPVPIGNDVNATDRPSTAAGRLTGWTVINEHETDAAVVRFYDGWDAANGSLIAVVALPAGASREFHHTAGLSFVHGLVVDIADVGAGTAADSVSGAVYLGATE